MHFQKLDISVQNNLQQVENWRLREDVKPEKTGIEFQQAPSFFTSFFIELLELSNNQDSN